MMGRSMRKPVTVTRPFWQGVFPPDTLDYWAGLINPAWSLSRVRARVQSVTPASRDAVTVVLKPNRRFAGFVAGQHLAVHVTLDGVRHTRSYSPSRLPDAPECLAITVQRVPGGRLSGYFCDQAAAGDLIELGDAFGDMTTATHARHTLLLAAGSGITPFIAQLRELALSPRSGQESLTLLYWVRDRASACFTDELDALARSLPGFRWQLRVTGDPADSAAASRLSAADLANWLGGRHAASATVLACGPAGFVSAAHGLSSALGVTCLGEAFSPPAQGEAGEPVRVRLLRSGRELSIPAGQALLPALEAAGVKPAFGCRMGVCNTCACAMPEGVVENLLTGEVSQEPSSALKLCVSAARSALVLDC